MQKSIEVTPQKTESKKLTMLGQKLKDMTDILNPGLYTTNQIYDTVKSYFPTLCNDNYTVKDRYGNWAKNDNRPVWKYAVRWALKNNKNNYNIEKLSDKTVWLVD